MTARDGVRCVVSPVDEEGVGKVNLGRGVGKADLGEGVGKVEPERAAARVGEPRVEGEIIEAEQVEEPEAGRRQAQKMQSPVRPSVGEVV